MGENPVQPTLISTRADDPQHLLLWSADEVIPMVVGLLFGMMIGQALVFFLFGVLITNLYRRFRDGHADGYLLHLFYNYGFGFTRSKSMVNPFIKRFFP